MIINTYNIVKKSFIHFSFAVIWRSVLECIETSIKNLLILDINPSDIVALGICNHRETTILWDSKTGLPLYNAIGKL